MTLSQILWQLRTRRKMEQENKEEPMSNDLRQLYNVNLLNKYNECSTQLNCLGEICGIISGEYEAIAEDINSAREIIEELTNAHMLHTPGCPNCEVCQSSSGEESGIVNPTVESDPESIMAMDIEFLPAEMQMRGVIYETETEAIQEVGEWIDHPENTPTAITAIKVLRQMADQLENKAKLAGLS